MVPPTGTVTFLFTDIEGSTALWENHQDEMRIALARHDALVRAAIEDSDGFVFKTIGDAFCAAFASPLQAVAAALQTQQALAAESWPSLVEIRVRMALHTGCVECRDNDYFGPALNRVSRLMGIGHGGQILVSAATQELALDQLPPKVALLDMGAHRLKDLGRVEQVFQLQHPDLKPEFRPLRSLGNPDLPNNLPQQITSFVGREKELADVKRLLETSRLLTLTAAGGTGKTRLSLQAAADLLDQYPDGVWFVELAALAEPDLLPQAIARVLNVTEVPGEPALKTLAAALKSSRLMLILDNCEHMVDTCSAVAADLLRACSGVTILASSRQALNVAGEVVYAVPALSLPDPKQPQSAATLTQFEAVQLFIDRATAVRSDFVVTNQNAPAVAQLCFRLDGIPLALELAAARVRVLSVEEINARLDNRFRLLTGGSRNVLPRQQTLRALVDWSYDLLNDQERLLFARLSVFAGGWDLPAAEAVCAGDGIEDWEIFDLMVALADKSLVVSEADSAEARFHLLETLRAYGREKLDALDPSDNADERHAMYYATAVIGEPASGVESRQSDAAWLLQEVENLRTALEWLWSAGRAEMAAAMSVCLRELWMRKGWFREGHGNLNRAVRALDAVPNVSLRARALKDAGWFAYMLGDLDTAESQTTASVGAAIAAGDSHGQASALNALGRIRQALGDTAGARLSFTEAIVLQRNLGDEPRLADYLMNLAVLESICGVANEAQAAFEEARSLYERSSNEEGMAVWLCNQSDFALRHGQWKHAQSLAEQSLARLRNLGNLVWIAYCLANLAEAASRQHDFALASSSAAEAMAICRDSNHLDLMPLLFKIQAQVCAMNSSGERAASFFAAAMRLRTLLRARPSADEQSEFDVLEASIRELEPTGVLESVGAQFMALGPDEIIQRLQCAV